MPINIPPPRVVDFRLSDTRKDALRNIDLQKVSFDVPESVEDARRAITKMGIWDSFVDSVFDEGRKEKALKIIAEKIICDMAALYEETPGLKSVFENVNDRKLAAHTAFLELLSPKDLTVVAGDRGGEDGLVWLTPTMTDIRLNHLLKISLPLDEVLQVLADGEMLDEALTIFRRAQRPVECAKISGIMASKSLPHEELKLREQEAFYWNKAGDPWKETEAWSGALAACEACEAARGNETYKADAKLAEEYRLSFDPAKKKVEKELEASIQRAMAADARDPSRGIVGL